MNANEITRQLIKARKAESAMREVLEAAEGIGLGAEQENELLRSKTQITKRVIELEAKQAEAKEAEEKARRAKAKTVKVRRYEWDEDSTVEVHLVPAEHSDTQWEVIYQTRHIGRVGSYTGSLDRQSGRLRIPGKERKLWHTQTPRSRSAYVSPLYGRVSRADAIRHLLVAAENGL